MAERRKGKRTRNPLSRLVEDFVDDAKDLVDDTLDRAKDLERDSRRAVRRAVDGDKKTQEMDELKSAIDELTAKVNRLAELQADAARKANS
jgi:polyhydroxyalkanoate synthesis regulator phasin